MIDRPFMRDDYVVFKVKKSKLNVAHIVFVVNQEKLLEHMYLIIKVNHMKLKLLIIYVIDIHIMIKDVIFFIILDMKYKPTYTGVVDIIT